jgi:hypothetical protein
MSETEARDSDGATPDETPTEEAEAAPEEPVEEPADELREDVPDEDPSDDWGDDRGVDGGPEPSWWHRSHPTFAGLVGFFAGVSYVIVVPGVYAALLGLLVSDATAQQLFPLVLVALLIPIALLVPRKTRRFAQFMFLGIVSTVVVVAVTAAVVIWALIQIDG